MRKLALTKERLLSMASHQGDCLIWQASLRAGRYGGIKHNGKTLGAHRVSYELHHGPIPAGAVVMHRCDNPLCVRPEHLRLGTQAENVKDMFAKGRANKARGEASGRAKLTADQVQEIRVRYEPRKYGKGAHALAREFGVSKPVIFAIIKRETWKHVE